MERRHIQITEYGSVPKREFGADNHPGRMSNWGAAKSFRHLNLLNLQGSFFARTPFVTADNNRCGIFDDLCPIDVSITFENVELFRALFNLRCEESKAVR